VMEVRPKLMCFVKSVRILAKVGDGGATKIDVFCKERSYTRESR
jgi:hypothetical protein